MLSNRIAHHALGLLVGFLPGLLTPTCTTHAAEAAPPQDESVTAFQDVLPSLPDGVGLAGPVAGRNGAMLVIAGGANFPDQPRWETAKAWHDRIQVLDLMDVDAGWRTSPTRLPHPLAYGISLTHPKYGIVSVGGVDGTAHRADSFLMQVDPDTLEATFESLPDLPITLAYAAGALQGDQVFVFGGQEKPDSTSASARLFVIDLFFR